MMDFITCARAFFIRDLQMALSYPLAFAWGQVTMIGRVLVLWLPAQFLSQSQLYQEHGGFLPYAVLGGTLISVAMAGYEGFAGAIRPEQTMGTLESVLMTRANVFSLVFGSWIWTMVDTLFDSALMLGAAMLVFDLQFEGSPWSALLLVLLTNLAFMGMGMFSAAFTVVFKRGDPIRTFVNAGSSLLGGVFYPMDVLPRWLQWLAELLPITHAARALRGVLLHGRPLEDFGTELVVLVVFAATTIFFGVFVFRAGVRQAKKDGTLLHY